MNNQQSTDLANTNLGTWSNTGQSLIDRRGFLKLLGGAAAATFLAVVNPESSAQEPENASLDVQNNSIEANLFDATLEDLYSPEVRTILNQIQHSVITNDYSNFDTLESKLNAIDVMSAFYVNTFNITDLEEISFYRSMRNRVSFFNEGEEPCGENASSCATFDRINGSTPLPQNLNWLSIYTHELTHIIPQSYALEALQREHRSYLINNSFIKQFDFNMQSSVIVGVSLNEEQSDIITDTAKISMLYEVTADILSDIFLQRITQSQLRTFGPYIDGYSARPYSQNTPDYYKQVIRYIASNSDGATSSRQAIHQFVKSNNSIAIGQILASTAINILDIHPDDIRLSSAQRRSNPTGGISSLILPESGVSFNLMNEIIIGTWIMGNLCENADYKASIINNRGRETRNPGINLLVDKSVIIERLKNNQDITGLIEVVWREL